MLLIYSNNGNIIIYVASIQKSGEEVLYIAIKITEQELLMKTLIRYSTSSISQGRTLNTLYMDKVELALAYICVNIIQLKQWFYICEKQPRRWKYFQNDHSIN